MLSSFAGMAARAGGRTAAPASTPPSLEHTLSFVYNESLPTAFLLLPRASETCAPHLLVDTDRQKAELRKYAVDELAIMQSGAAGGQ